MAVPLLEEDEGRDLRSELLFPLRVIAPINQCSRANLASSDQTISCIKEKKANRSSSDKSNSTRSPRRSVLYLSGQTSCTGQSTCHLAVFELTTRYLTTSTGGYWGVEPLLQDMRNYASPKALYGVAESLAHAHRAYGPSDTSLGPGDPVILFVVQPGERNVFDQRLIEYELLSR